MLTDREGEYSEGWPWPMMTKAVESVIENMQIEARLQQNEQAIVDMEAVIDPELPATLNRIEGALHGQDIRIDSIESINIGQALADIEASIDPGLPATLNGIEDELGDQDRRIDSIEFDIEAAMDPELPATLNRIDGKLVDQNNRLNYLEAIDFVDKGYLQDNIQFVFTGIGKHYYNKGYCDKYFTRNDALDVRLLSYMRTDELGSYLDPKLNRAEFDSFLMGKMTQETIDQIAFSLADVDVNGVRMNLGTALEDRPSFDQVPGIEFTSSNRVKFKEPPLTLDSWIDYLDFERWKSYKTDSIFGANGLNLPLYRPAPEELGWIDIIADNKNRLDNLPEIPDLPDIGGMKTCFTDGGNVLENLTKSMEAKIGEIEVRFDSMKTQMYDVNNEFIALNGKIQEWLDATGNGYISPGTFIDGVKELFAEFRNTFSRMSGDFSQTGSDFDESRNAFSDIRDKVTALKNCGISNMNWNPS